MSSKVEIRTTADGTPFVRTPDDRFADLPDFPFEPRYVAFQGLRMHYVDAGPPGGPVALLMHGMPTWSYLNRHIIRELTAQGWRCIAPDHIGFGRSDKVVDPDWYSIRRHAEACRALIETLDLTEVTLFVQDWGGPIGLAQAARAPDRFARLVVMSTWLPHADYAYSPAIRDWAAGWRAGGLFDAAVPDRFTLGWILLLALRHIRQADLIALAQGGPPPALSPAAAAILRAYDAPHAGLGPGVYAGPRRFPLSIPIDRPDDETALDGARHFEALKSWVKPIHFIWGGADPIFTEAWGRRWAGLYPQATFDILPGAGHFLQDSHGEEIARLVLGHIDAT